MFLPSLCCKDTVDFMSSRRVLKVAEAIREVVSMAILVELRDPRIQHVTVTYVEVSGDLRHAKVHVSIMGDEKKEQLALHGLQSAIVCNEKCDNWDNRYIPRLKFVLDKGVKSSLAVARILEDVLPEDPEPETPSADGSSSSLLGSDYEDSED